jgi:hypothetical protein
VKKHWEIGESPPLAVAFSAFFQTLPISVLKSPSQTHTTAHTRAASSDRDGPTAAGHKGAASATVRFDSEAEFRNFLERGAAEKH